jgi:hypothetical protein
MKPRTLWIIRAALTVQFLGVLAVPLLVAAAESPRGTEVAEWFRPASPERSAAVSIIDQAWELLSANAR